MSRGLINVELLEDYIRSFEYLCSLQYNNCWRNV